MTAYSVITYRVASALTLLGLTAFATGCNEQATITGDSIEVANQPLFAGGEVRLHAKVNFQGHFAAIPVATDTLVGAAELRDYSMNDNAASLQLFNIPNQASVYLYQDYPAGGSFVEITGADTAVSVPDLWEMNNRASLIYIGDHGFGSIRFGIDLLHSRLEQVALPSDERLHWLERRILLNPEGDTITFKVRGNVDVPVFRDKEVIVEVYGRPELSGGVLRISYAGHNKDVNRCGITIRVCKRIRRDIDAAFDPNRDGVIDASEIAEIEMRYFGQANAELALLSSLISSACGQLSSMRVNNLPDAVELVISEDAGTATCVEQAMAGLSPNLKTLVSTDRPAGHLRFGTANE